MAVTLTSSRSLVHDPRHPYVTLVGIDVCYTWITKTSRKSLSSGQGFLSGDSHPFSRWLLLPLETLLNDAVYKFVTWHLVRCAVHSSFNCMRIVYEILDGTL